MATTATIPVRRTTERGRGGEDLRGSDVVTTDEPIRPNEGDDLLRGRRAGTRRLLDSRPAAPVAQGIERRPPEPEAQVRILPGAPRGRTMPTMTDPRDMRAPTGFHDDHPLDRADLDDDPIEQFRRWLADAEAAGTPLPNAMALATAGADGKPGVRHVLLRGVDERGLTFFTNYDSRKGRQLAENPWAALVFLWKGLDRQVHVSGRVTRVEEAESDAYFATRPREAQLGAWASPQSQALGDRGELDRRLAEVDARFPGDVPRPPFWGGFRVRPDSIEFWQGRHHRLHDRFLYSADPADPTGWRVERLSP